MNTVSFYQHLYETEWQTRDHLQAAVSTPLSVLVLVATGLVLLAQNFRTDHHGLEIVFWSAYAVAAAGFMVAVYMLIRSFHGYVYRRIPLPSQLLAYHEGLLRHYTALGRPGLANDEFDLYLRQRYVEAGDRNAVHNTNRFDYLHQANRGIILSLLRTGSLHRSARARHPTVQCGFVPGSAHPMKREYRMTIRQMHPATPPSPGAVPPKPEPPPNIDVKRGLKVPKPLADYGRGRRP